MLIDSLAIDPGPQINYDQAFRNVLEDFMSVLRTNAGNAALNIDVNIAYKYESDLFGLLNYYNIQPALHWVVMRMNNLTSPTDYTSSMVSLLLPDSNVINQIRQSHMTTRRIN